MPTLKELHEFAVEEGIKEDPRDREQIENILEKRKEEYEELEGPRKERFDEDRLDNPFDDSKVIFGKDREIKTLAVGVDIGPQELLLVDRLNEKGKGIDGVMTHHPRGKALAGLHEVMKLQVDALTKVGISVSQAEGIVTPRMQEIKRTIHPANHPRVPRTAKLLDVPLMGLHTVTDNHAYQFVKDYLDEEDPWTLGDLVDALLEIPEYEWSLEYRMGPEIFAGDESNRTGKIGVLGFTGGTDLGEELIEEMVNAGVDTLVAMHATKKQVKKAKGENINVVTAGHMPSDNIGINLLLDKMNKEFGIETFELAGFKRVTR